MNAQLRNPEVETKRKALATQVYTITRKAVDWGEANGYSALIRDVDKFMTAYRKAMREEAAAKAANSLRDFYSRQSPEKLAEMARRAEAKYTRIAQALKAKGNSNGHY